MQPALAARHAAPHIASAQHTCSTLCSQCSQLAARCADSARSSPRSSADSICAAHLQYVVQPAPVARSLQLVGGKSPGRMRCMLLTRGTHHTLHAEATLPSCLAARRAACSPAAVQQLVCSLAAAYSVAMHGGCIHKAPRMANFQHRFVFPVKTCSVSSCKHVIFDIAVGSRSLVMVFGNAIFVYSATHTFLINMRLREHRSFSWFSYKSPMRIRHIDCFTPHSIARSAVASCMFTLWEGPHAVKFHSCGHAVRSFCVRFP